MTPSSLLGGVPDRDPEGFRALAVPDVAVVLAGRLYDPIGCFVCFLSPEGGCVVAEVSDGSVMI
ncbi:hypothetical protein LX15_006274 [Streptoalloteichus tenebrarius]|uniref:Uncharacterized protein n=1 Tax=Streptoalloteichus tenebrarius (strain ATCC 17920 / DSM 40477 / JCM 4838 / CBS 697.72 / NBRC 16177 / NCIMB 11028 / NRRL B-12390 / A12253. 1 / ISP 5477) TaxID=1933 RepID=A0ABT1I454_STRSD|nr:hypothetical protein [Streptoalloteichus tenebrarius]MCP2262534.1 hypothetical protein [Streptoalloteichus tenebrarius]